jgi:DNA-binding transcriptional ArsR family regulator
MNNALKAIAEPRRQEILRLVWNQERAAGDIAQHFDVSRPAISKHLRILREAGLLDERRKGTQRLYSARAEPLLELWRFLDSFWDEGLQAIKQAAEAGSAAVSKDDDRTSGYRARGRDRGSAG